MSSQSLAGLKGTHASTPLQPTSGRHGQTPLGKPRTLKQTDKNGRDLSKPATHASSTSLAWPTETETQRQHQRSRTSHHIADVADELLESLRNTRELAGRLETSHRELSERQCQQGNTQIEDGGQLKPSAATAVSGLLSHEGIMSHAVPIRRKRSPWNKGLSIPESTKLKISQAQKRRWRNSPELRAAICSKLKGRVAWNKGKKMSPETRQKMSLAKLGRHVPRAVRRQMSKSHQGLTHTPETAKRLSEQLSGVPKSPEHREAISVAQRNRLMVTGILRAVETVHSAEEASTSYAPKPTGRGLSGRAAGRMMDSAVLSTYKSELREFRALQEELEPWTAAFKAKNGRKPCLADVESTRIPWLINKYKQYIIMRERLLNDTQSLRTKLQRAIPDPSMGGKEQDNSATADRVNSNTVPTSSGSDVGMRMRQALDYKRSRAANATTGAAAALSAQSAGTSAEACAPSAAAPAASQKFAGKTFSGSSVSARATGSGGKLSNLPPNAPLRVRNAMNAAMQYRQEKAERSAAAAREAAAAAAAKAAERVRPSANGAAGRQPATSSLQASSLGELTGSCDSSAALASDGARRNRSPEAEEILRGVTSTVDVAQQQRSSEEEPLVAMVAPSAA